MIADDDNRVILAPIDEYDSDYVNASYIDVSTPTHTHTHTHTHTLYVHMNVL